MANMDIGGIIGTVFFSLLVAVAAWWIIREIVDWKRKVKRSWFMYAGVRFNPYVDDKHTKLPILPGGWYWNVSETHDKEVVVTLYYRGEEVRREVEPWSGWYKPRVQIYNMAYNIIYRLYKEVTPQVNPRAHLLGDYPPKSL